MEQNYKRVKGIDTLWNPVQGMEQKVLYICVCVLVCVCMFSGVYIKYKQSVLLHPAGMDHHGTKL